MLIPSTLDDSLAPPGAHVASLFCQHVAPQFTDGSSWDQHREAVADLMIDTVETYAPGFKASVIARQSLSPFDLERDLRFAQRRHLPWRAHARSAFLRASDAGIRRLSHAGPGLYLCGAGAHPGGGVTGAPGHNAAQAVIADLHKMKCAGSRSRRKPVMICRLQMTSREFAANRGPCPHASIASAARRSGSACSRRSRSSGAPISRPIAAPSYRTRKRRGASGAAQDTCSKSTANGPSTARHAGMSGATSIIPASPMRSRSCARAGSCSSRCVASPPARK